MDITRRETMLVSESELLRVNPLITDITGLDEYIRSGVGTTEAVSSDNQRRRPTRSSTRETCGEKVAYTREIFEFATKLPRPTDTECSICYATNKDLSSENKMFTTKCNHTFCNDCMREWAKKNCTYFKGDGFYTTCPCCRTNLKFGEEYTDFEKVVAKIKHVLRLPKTYNTTMPIIQSLIDKMNAKDLKVLAGHSILNKIDNVDLTLAEIKLTGKNKAQLQTDIRYRIGELYKLYSLTHRGH